MKQSRKEFIQKTGVAGISAFAGFNYFPLHRVHPNIKPRSLKRGDTIGMISPGSSLSDKQQYNEVANTIRELGFKVRIGAHARDQYGYLAGTDENRAADLNTMFADPEVDAILPFRGGWGSNRILSLIDYDKVRNNPKALIGFSDITSLLLAIYAKTGLVTFHGPVGKSEWTPFTKSHFKNVLMDENKFLLTASSNGTDSPSMTIETITGGTARGTLLGGNLSVLTAMLGSDYMPDWRGSILFLEDVGEDIYRIDRMLTQLKLNGIFDEINGFIFGKCTNCEVSSGPHFTLKEVIKGHLKPYGVPVFMGANIGHIDDMVTLPVGINAQIDANSGSITMLESAVKTSTA